MRTIGLSWTEWKTPWSASDDENVAECPAPQMQRKSFKALGTPTVQAAALSSDRTDLSAEEVLNRARLKRAELEAAGEIDWVCDRQPHAVGQGPTPDRNLVGKTLEVRWRYHHKDTGKPVYIWCEGEVVQIADGESDRQTPRCKKLLPAGAVRIKWPADVEYDEAESYVWSVLKPSAFNKDVHLGWRYAGCELKRMEAAHCKRKRQK
ncbi:hypothetical protein AB1Y20_021907 [Prymnesium parvum]|uniref:Uncharacterized protein n=1 Tax=Prymnesium parvum TaxID=97485 RepID=A0AB34JFD8_PRYPA